MAQEKETVTGSNHLIHEVFADGAGEIFFIDRDDKKYSSGVVRQKEIDIALELMVNSWVQLKDDYAEGLKNEDNLILKFQLHIRRLQELSAVFAYNVIHDLTTSLKTYTQDINIKEKHQRDVIQTHIDMIYLAYNRDVKIEDKAAVKALWDTLHQVY